LGGGKLELLQLKKSLKKIDLLDYFILAFLTSFIIAWPLSFFIKSSGYFVFLISIFSASLMFLLSSFLAEKKQYLYLGAVKFVQVIMQVLLTLCLNDFGSQGLVVAFIVPPLVLYVCFVFFYRENKKNRLAYMANAVLKNRRFIIYSSLSSLIFLLPPVIPGILVDKVWGVAYVGIYFFLAQIFSLSLSPIRRSLTNYLISISSSLDSKKFYFFITFGLKVLPIYICIVAVMGWCVFVYAEGVILILFGPKWTTAGDFAFVFFIFFSIDLILTPFSQTLNVRGLERQYLILVLMKMSIAVCIAVAFMSLDNPGFLLYVSLHFFNISFFLILMACIVFFDQANRNKNERK